jgi:tRNA G46 methylase TrmB
MLTRDEGTIAAGNMDRMYRHQRRIYDFTRKFYLLGRDGMIRRLNPAPEARVLEIGCGTGRNLILAAKDFPDADFFGIDISEEMLTTARVTCSMMRSPSHRQMQRTSTPKRCLASNASSGFSSLIVSQ